MNKITINLNPQKERASSEFLQKVLPFAPFLGLAVAAVLILILLTQVFVFKKIHTHNVYNKRWKQQQDKFSLLQKIKKQTTTLEIEKNKLADITISKARIEIILEGIFSSLPKNLWLESLSFNESFINLKGYAVKWDEDYLTSLDEFINSLRRKEYFSSKFDKINIKESKLTTFNKVEVLEFIIECKN